MRCFQLCFLLLATAAGLTAACARAAAAPPISGDTVLVHEYRVSREAARPFSSCTYAHPRHPRVGLVFSGGGARGIAQIGVLRALSEAGIQPDFIVGTSIGSIVGGLYAAGYSPVLLEHIARTTDWDNLFRLSNQGERANMLVDQKPVYDRSIFTIRFDGLRPVLPVSVSNGQRLTNLLNELTLQALYHAVDFDSLRVPFRAVATDLYTGKRVVLRDGNLAEALRASATIPVLFAPVQRDTFALVDGGLHANIPVDIARSAGCDIVCAINTASPMRTREQINNPLETLDQMLTIMMDQNNVEQLAHATTVITPELGSILSSDFSHVDSLLQLGYEAGRAALPRLRWQLDSVRTAMQPLEDAGDPPPVPVHTTFAVSRSDSTWCRTPRTAMEVHAKALAWLEEDTFSSMTLSRISTSEDAHWCLSARELPRIIDVRLEGTRALHGSQVTAYMQALKGRHVSADAFRGACEGLLRLYRDQGYSLARIRTSEFDESTGILSLSVTEGEVDTVRVEGISRTNDVVVLREFPVRNGSLFRIEDARVGLRNLTALNLFHQVSFDVIEHQPTSSVRIRVEERSSLTLQGMMRIDDERNAQFGMELRDANLFGTGTDMNLAFYGGVRNRRYALEYATNKIFYTPMSFRLSGFWDLRDFNHYAETGNAGDATYQRESIGSYRRIAYGAIGTLGLYVEKFGDLHAIFRAEEQQQRTLSSRTSAMPDLSEHHRVIALGVGTTIDTQDRFPYPTHGMYFNATYLSAQERLGSDVSFTRFNTEYAVYVSSPGGTWTFRPQMRFGYGDRTLPRTEEFRLGGQHSFLGMRENEFTGRQLFTADFEVRYLLPFKLLFDTWASGHYSVGRTWEMPEQISLGDLRHGFGLSIGIATPIGPADFAIGRSFVLPGSGASDQTRWGPVNVYFSLGLGM